MADPLPVSIRLSFTVIRTDDAELTCFLCGRQGCEYEFSYRARGARVTAGAHGDCAAADKVVQIAVVPAKVEPDIEGHSFLLVLTASGRIYRMCVWDAPEGNWDGEPWEQLPPLPDAGAQ